MPGSPGGPIGFGPPGLGIFHPNTALDGTSTLSWGGWNDTFSGNVSADIYSDWLPDVLDVPGVDDSVQAWAIQPPTAPAFNPSSGFPWNLDDGERFVGSQCYPDPTTDLVNAFLPIVASSFVFAWTADPGEVVQQQPVVDDTVQSWAVEFPWGDWSSTFSGTVSADIYAQWPLDVIADATPDPTVQSYAIQPPAAAGFDPATGFPWARDDNELFVRDQNVPEPDSAVEFGVSLFDPANGFPWNADEGERFVTAALIGEDWQAWAVQPPAAVTTVTQLSAFAVDGGEVLAQPTADESVQAWAVGPPQNAVAALAFNTPDEAREIPVEDPTVPTYAIQPPPYIPVFQETAWTGDPENWQQVPDDDPSVQSWAIQPPLNADRMTAWNGDGGEVQATTVTDDTVLVWPIAAVNAFDPSTTPWTGSDDIVQPVWAIADDTAPAWSPVPPPVGIFNIPQEMAPDAWVIDQPQPQGIWAATFGFIPTVIGGFPPGATAAGHTVGLSGTNASPRGGASGPTPGGNASNPKPGA